jgi:TatD DNase family protein
MIKLFDSHCHADFATYRDDQDDVIRQAGESGVGIINVGTHYETSKSSIGLAEKYEHVWAAVGMHPSHAADSDHADPDEGEITEKFDIDKYRSLAVSSTRVVALGECGLDYFRINPENAASKAAQKSLLREQLKLAQELNLPISFHCRAAKKNPVAAYDDLLEILRSHNVTGVVHCFSETSEVAKNFLDLGFYISFTGIITFKNASPKLLEAVKVIPLHKVLVETDAPYLAPEPYRGQRNEPAYVKYVAEKIAAIKNLTYEQVAEQTTENVRHLFKI